MKTIITTLALAFPLAASATPICYAVTTGIVCHDTSPTPPPPTAMCLDGSGHVVPCDTVLPTAGTRCSLTFEWDLGDPDHPTVTALTPVCADEAPVAASETVTKIIKLRN